MFAERLLASFGRRDRVRDGGVRTLALATMAASCASIVSATVAEAKTPGKTYCFHSTCHRVKTLAETEALVGRDITLTASHYDSCKRDRFNPCGLTSSGEKFHSDRPDNAASPILPDGTIALVWAKGTREAIVLRINNAGPYWGNRKLDLSRSAARKLGIGGVGEVTLRVLKAPGPDEARYARNRVYDPVPGPIGQFASLDAAHGAMTVMVALGQPGTTALAGLAGRPTATDPAVNVASLLKTPLVPRLGIPPGALAEALAAQSAAERRLVTASAPPATTIYASQQVSLDVPSVVPKLTAAEAVTPRRTVVRSVDVAAAEAEPAAKTSAVTAAVPAAQPRSAVRAAKAERKRVAAVRVATAKSRRVAPEKFARVADATPAPRPAARNGEINVGFTTYAEARYQTKAASLRGKSRKPAKPSITSPNAPAIAAVPAALTATKRAGLTKGGKSAALRKTGGWQSSAVMAPLDALVPRPHLTGPHRSVPAGEMRDETEMPRRPGRRVHPSALV